MYDSSWDTMPVDDMVFDECDDVTGLNFSEWNRFSPFGEVVSNCQDESITFD